MSSSSLASWASDGTNAALLPHSLHSAPKHHKFFDKCPQCRAQYDFLKRVNSTSSKVPLVLNCRHTICEDCIRRLCLASNCVCPVCHEKFTLLRTQLDNITQIFAPHYSLIGYLMWTKNSPNKRQMNWITTGVTLKSKQAVSTDTLNTSMETEERSDDESVDEDFDRVVLSMDFEQCPEHSDGYLNIHCEDCNDTVCCYCYVEKHGGHQPIYLYKLTDQEMAELQQSKIHMEVILKQLQKSQKKSKELKTFDLTTVENNIRGYFAEIHAKLHVAEQNIRKELTTLTADETDLGSVNSSIKSAIWRVTQVLNIYNMLNKKQLNIRALYEEVQDLKSIPCRLISDCGALEPIEFVSRNSFDNIEQNFTLKKLPGLEYSLLPIEDWTCDEEDSQSDVSKTKYTTANHHDQKVDVPRSSETTSGFNESRPRKSSSEGGKTKIIVTHLNDLNSFYVQKYSVLASLKQMNKTIERKSRRKLNSEEIAVGRIYGVLYETKNSVHWRRGKLVDIIKKGANNVLYSMFFIDYGNTQCVTKDKLRELDYHVVKRLPFAFECKLTNPENVTFDTNAHLRLSQIIGEKELFLHYTSKQSNGVQEVDLLIPSSSGNAVSVRDILLQKPSINEKEEIFVAKQLKLFKNSKKFSLGQEEQVVVSYVKDPFNISVLQLQNMDAIEKLRHDMSIFYEHRRSISCIPAEGTDVVVKYEHEKYGNWHRATITSLGMGNQTVSVDFVDWGGSASVSWSNVKLLTEQFTKMECQAIVVKLADVQPHNLEDPWSLEAINFLQEQVLSENRCRMLVCNVDPLEVGLFQVRPSVDICLNSLLVERNLAVSTGNISDTLYWPNQQETQADNEDEDEFSYQLIKKAETVLIEDEDSELKDGVKQQVVVVHFESPDLIFVKFVKYRAQEEEVHKELQIHYISRRKSKDEWKPSEYCVVFDASRNQYFRGIIKAKSGKDGYIVYLYDHVRELKVAKHSVFILETYFKQFGCRVCKIRLAGIRPAGDRGKWSRLAVEILQKIFAAYKIIHIKKIESNANEKKMGVLMWYGLSTPAKALEASKLNYVPINKVLVESGVAFSVQSAVSNSIDANKSHESEKQNDEEMEKSTGSDEDTKVTSNCKSTQDWYQMICEDEEESVQNVLQSWPPPMPLQRLEFDAVLTCVDSEGCFSIREEELNSLYLEMESKLNSKFNSLQLTSEKMEWRASEMCTILDDNLWYRGAVIDILDGDEISVEMIDFGSEHVLKKDQIYKHIMFPDVPPFVNKVKLYDVYPKYGGWSANDVKDLLDIVADNIKVVIKDDRNSDVPAAEIYLQNGLSVNDLITQKCPHLVRYENRVALRNVEDDENEVTENEEDVQEVDSMSCESKDSTKSSDNVNSNPWSYTYAPIPELRNGRVKMMILNVLKWKSEYNAVLKLRNDESPQNLKALNQEIQEQIDQQPRLEVIEINEPCVCFHAQNNMWCRAIVYGTDDLQSGYILAFFVDYGTVDLVNIQNVRVMRPEWFDLPVYNRIATINIELIDSSKAEHVLMQMNNLRGKFATVEITSDDPFKVHLSDSKGFCYQNLINCGIIRAL